MPDSVNPIPVLIRISDYKTPSWNVIKRDCILFQIKIIVTVLFSIGLMTSIIYTVNNIMFQQISFDFPSKEFLQLKYYQYKNDYLNSTDKMIQFQTDNFHKFSKTLQIPGLVKDVSMVYHDPANDIYVSKALDSGSFWEQGTVRSVIRHIDFILSQYGILPCNSEFENDQQCNNIKRGLGILDVGANIGVWSVPFGKYFQHRYPFISIFSFEPLWSNYMLLSKSIELNELSNVYVYPYGLTNEGNIGDTKSFVIDAQNKGHSHIEGNHSWSEHDGEIIQIETLPINKMLKPQNFRPIDAFDTFQNILWMKIDTEGYEKFVFLGADKFFADYKNGAPCFIFTEYWKGHRHELFDLLTKEYDYFLAGTENTFNWRSIEQNAVSNNIPKSASDVIFVKNNVEQCIQHKIDSMM